MIALADHDLADLCWRILAPDEATDLWAWCAAHTRLPNGRPWDPRRARLMRRWYRILDARLRRQPLPGHPTAHLAEEVWLVLGAQLFKSTLLLQLLLAMMAQYPRKSAIFMHRARDLKAVQKGKLLPMIERCPPTEALLPRSLMAREHALSADLWQVGAAQLYWQQGSTADDYRREDYELIVADEIDKFPRDVDGEGDPISLLRVRGRTYPHTFLMVGASTPTEVDGLAWSSLCDGSHERPLVILPCCHYADALDPEQVLLADGHDWRDVRIAEILDRRLGRYACPHCGTLLTDRELRRAIDDCADHDRWCPGVWSINAAHPSGHWQPTAPRDSAGRLTGTIPPPEGRTLSGQACSLYSPLVSLSRFAADRARAERGSRLRKLTWRNVEAALPTIQTITTTSVDAVTAATVPPETYQSGALPWPVDLVLLFFDQQGNTRDRYWWPYVVRGLTRPRAGQRARSWLIAAGTARDTAERDALAERAWSIGGRQRAADHVAIDSANGNAKADLYLWAAADPGRRLLLYGDSRVPPGELWQLIEDGPKVRRRTPKPTGVIEYRIHPHRWRDRLWECIQGSADACAAWYLPTDPDPRYLASLTSEEQATELRRVPGRGLVNEVVWRPRQTKEVDGSTTFRSDNHWWDSEADLLALCDILGLLTADDQATDPQPEPATAAAGGTWSGAGDDW